MPNLAGIVDLTENPSVDLAMAQQIGGVINQGLQARRIRQQEELNQRVYGGMIGVLNQAATEDWDGTKTLTALMQVPGMAQSAYAKEVQQAALQQQMKRAFAPQYPTAAPEGTNLVPTGGSYDEFGNFKATFGPPKSTTSMAQLVKGADGWYRVDKATGEQKKLDIPVDDTQSAMTEIDVDGRPTKVLYNKANGEIIGEIGASPQRPTLRQGADGKYYVVEGTQSTPVAGMPERPQRNTDVQNKLQQARAALSRYTDIMGDPKEGKEQEYAKWDKIVTDLENQLFPQEQSQTAEVQTAKPVVPQTAQKSAAEQDPHAQKFTQPPLPVKQSKARQNIEIEATLTSMGLPIEQTDYVLDRLSKFTEQDQAEFVEVLRTGNVAAIQKALNVLNGNQ